MPREMIAARSWRRHLLAVCACAGAVAVGPSQQDPPVPAPKGQPAPRPVNRLAKEASPYLRQHQHNPVDWYPWGDAALQRAKKEDKPIFLSIGYSACHWCHVMAEESFADPDVAALLNEHFVCVKVDREERPDVDEVYMAAVQAMGQQGGWPLSAWLTPAGKPFYGGTYFPPEDGHGRPGFRRVCRELAKAWKEQREQVLTASDELTKHLQTSLAPVWTPGEPTVELLAKLLPQSRERYDAVHGGFAQPPLFAPKFPSALELQALLRLDGDGADDALRMVTATLRAMHGGGMFDQLGGGFHRYSTDRQWLVPHFEKMLYDNALLVPCYLEAHVRTGDTSFATCARETLDWMLREMRAPEGGFWSSQDAQSEGVEGKFFVWQKDEVDALLGDRAALACARFGITADGNWEHTNVLTRARDVRELAKELGRDPAAVASDVAVVQAVMRAARDERVRPGTDDKVLAAWNGLALRALAAGYRVLGDERYRDAARAAAAFACEHLVRDGRALRAWHGGTARHAGVLEDHAALADGLIAVFEIDSDPRWLQTARDLLRTIATRFRADDGALWSTADDHEQLLARTRMAWDASTPSGTALAAQAFLAAGLLLGDEELYGHGVAVLRSNHKLLAETPAAAPALVRALQFHVGDPREVVIAGDPADARTQALLRAAWRGLLRPQVVAHLHAQNRGALEKLAPVFAGKAPVDGAPAAYVCRRGVCEAPVTDPAKVERP
jgi:uncharacterized protein YyaL (SSP411 family)